MLLNIAAQVAFNFVVFRNNGIKLVNIVLIEILNALGGIHLSFRQNLVGDCRPYAVNIPKGDINSFCLW